MGIMNKWDRILIAVVMIITAAFLLCIGQWKGTTEKPESMYTPQPTPLPTTSPETPYIVRDPVRYQQKIEVIHGNRQVINILEVNLKAEDVKIRPVLSHDSIFGFETTSSMAKRVKAKAAVNGGFFHAYGQPSGITVVNGQLLCTSDKPGKRTVFLIDGQGKAQMIDLGIEVFIEIGEQMLKVNGINREPASNEIIIYTPVYGLTTRTNGRNTFNIVGENKILQRTLSTGQEVRIPEKGLVVTATGDKIKELKMFLDASHYHIGVNMEMHYRTTPPIEYIEQAFEGGFWVIKDGNPVIRKKEGWVGLTTNREPRTVVGMKDEHTVIFMTIDGRQPGYSIGLTGQELARYLLECGIDNALMLDGGASTTMVVDGRTVNKPSYRGRERMVGGAIVILVDK